MVCLNCCHSLRLATSAPFLELGIWMLYADDSLFFGLSMLVLQRQWIINVSYATGVYNAPERQDRCIEPILLAFISLPNVLFLARSRLFEYVD